MAIPRVQASQSSPEPFPNSPFLAAFEVLLSPREAFEKMRSQESFTSPLLLAGTAGLANGIANAVVYALFVTKAAGRIATAMGSPIPAEPLGGAGGFVVTLVVSAVASVAGSLASVPMGGAIFWLASRLFGATGPFSHACRIAAYSQAVLFPASVLCFALLPLAGMPIATLGWGICFLSMLQLGILFWTFVIVGRGFTVLLDASETGVKVVTWIFGALVSLMILGSIPIALGWQASVREYARQQREFESRRAAMPTPPVRQSTHVVASTPIVKATPRIADEKRKLSRVPAATLKRPEDLVPNVKRELFAARIPVKDLTLTVAPEGGWNLALDLLATETGDVSRSEEMALFVIGRYLQSSGLKTRSIRIRHLLDDGRVKAERPVSAEDAIAATRF